jgi:hypothetical protein
MSSDELLLTVAAVIVGPVLWAIWILRMSRLQMVRAGRGSVVPIVAALTAGVLLLFFVLTTGASYDVVAAP